MTSDGVFVRVRRGTLSHAAVLGLLLGETVVGSARAADPSYPFEGTWVRANRVCTANAPRVRTYTAHDVTFPTGHCTFRKVAKGDGQYEIFEDCRRADHPGNYTETIRMPGPDGMEMRRKAGRLKIARPLRYVRCTAAAPHHAGEPAPHPADEHAVKPPEAKPPEPKP